jgi:hypothetical protein
MDLASMRVPSPTVVEMSAPSNDTRS